MNTYKAILDTRRPNGVIANITQFDNATLELQIVTNGEIGDAWNEPQFELVAMKRDQQAVRESDQGAFTINDVGEHQVTVKLKEQFLTCRGSVKMQLVVKDGDRLSTSVFYVMIGESLDHGIVESHRDVAVLDELEQYVKTGYDGLAHQEQRMKDVEKATHELNELMVGNEAERQEAESKRQALFEGNEGQRQNTFNQQLTSQRREFEDSQGDREGAFNDLKQNMSSEFNAAQNEREREFDTMMSSNQAQFDSAERSRANTFNNRQIENERTFTANENARQTVFNANEAGRKTNETDRVANENTRKTNETGRVAAESKRQQKMSEFEAKATQLSNELDAQVARVDAFVSANEEKLLGDRDKVDYMGNTHESVKAASDANVDWLLGEVNTAHYEGQHITANDTIEGRAKSAILKGNTLINMAKQQEAEIIFNRRYQNYAVGNNVRPGGLIHGECIYMSMEVNIHELNIETSSFKCVSYRDDGGYEVRVKSFDGIKNIPKNTWVKISTIRRVNEAESLYNYSLQFGLHGEHPTVNGEQIARVSFRNPIWINLTKIYGNGNEPTLTECDNIPYFEGMASVKMPVLTTSNGFEIFKTGTTLDEFDYNLVNLNNGCISIPHSHVAYIETKKEYTLLPNQSYAVRVVEVSNYNNSHYCINLNIGDRQLRKVAEPLLTEELSKNSYYDIVCTNTTGEPITGVIRVDSYFGEYKIDKIYIGEEPFKSNILTVNEEVELGSVGDVRDTLNLITGEVVKRTEEFTLNDSSKIGEYAHGIIPSTHKGFVYSGENFDYELSNLWSCISTHDLKLLDWSNSGLIYGYINKSLLDSEDLTGLKNFFNNNTVTVRWKKSQSSIKTVDLSDNVVYSYDEVTHYDCSSEAGSLIPTLSVDVPTNLSALVSRQRATIETLETENRALKEGQVELELGHEQQEEEIISTQDAVNFLLFDVLDMVPYELGQKEYDRMAVYIANQIIRGKVTYQLAVSKYPQFLTDIDEILINEGRGDLIVKID